MRPTPQPDPAQRPASAASDPEHREARPATGRDTVTAKVVQARALLICCVLAENFSPLPLRDLDIPAAQVRHAVDAALRTTPVEYLLGWRRRVAAWSVRWDAARHAAATYFPDDLPGEDEIPELDALGEVRLNDTEQAMLTSLCQDTSDRSASRP
ncbi:hypothetical protein ACIQUM_07280 [Amycolatopsis azurea]|uniref:hypothetical protein n=1 Tax=Amycolatopsis azurea TaxID=36819 RepID=UPI00380CAD09